jgi:hypothetical protein
LDICFSLLPDEAVKYNSIYLSAFAEDQELARGAPRQFGFTDGEIEKLFG